MAYLKTSEELKDFFKNLPRKYMAAGALFFDEQGRVLLVKPTYKPGWEVPGGVVEREESPLSAMQREVKEETSLSISQARALCIQYIPNFDERGDRLIFVFDGGTLSKKQIDSIVLPKDELSELRFFTTEEVQKEIEGSYLRSRILEGIRARKEQRTIYFEGKI